MSDQAEADSTSRDRSDQTDRQTKVAARPLRIWPVLLLLAVMWGLRSIPQLVENMSPELLPAAFFGPAACGLLILAWWLFFSRAQIKEKLLGLVGLVVIIGVTTALSDKSIRGFGTAIFAIPWGFTAFGGTLALFSRLAAPGRTWLGLLAAVIGFGYWDAVRSDGVWGDFKSSLSWRWAPTAEDEFLEQLATRPAAGEIDRGDEPLAPAEWPAFRGPSRDGRQPGVALSTEWNDDSVQEVWRVRVGPGWSSFALAGKRLFTQEQRGEEEAVVCYDAETGTERWAHKYESRFWEAVAGAGPRATPTIAGQMLYSQGAEGWLFAIDPVSGEVAWKRDLREDAGRDPPIWGFSGSPLVVDDRVIVHAGGEEGKGLIAYERDSGDIAWTAPTGNDSYSSPQLSELDGRQCILILTNTGLTAVAPDDGTVLGESEWEYQGYRVVQPLKVGPSSVLLGTGMGAGTRRVDIALEGQQLISTEVWTSKRISPNYNDYVSHEGFLYGFDNNVFACVDLEGGERRWKKGRYGNGQVLLLPDASQLLVISESGELVLLSANPERLEELARWKVLDGKTWNHPVLVGNRVYVRNGEEAACFELPLAP